MAPKKRTSTKQKSAAPQQQEKWVQTPEAIGRDTWKMAGWSRAKYRLLGQLFPWFGPAVEKACPYDPKNPPWSVNSESLQKIRRRADDQWTALTGLSPLDSGDPGRWVAAIAAAGYSVAQARQMTVEQLAEIILGWALGIRTARQQTQLAALSKPMAKIDIARDLGYTSVRSLNRLIEAGGVVLVPHGKLFRYYVPLKIDGTE